MAAAAGAGVVAVVAAEQARAQVQEPLWPAGGSPLLWSKRWTAQRPTQKRRA